MCSVNPAPGVGVNPVASVGEVTGSAADPSFVKAHRHRLT